MMTVLSVALGGALGAVLRYGLKLAVTGPLGTLAVNALGCFAMGLALVALLEGADGRWVPLLAPFLMTGLLGGFTTYSAFALDTLVLVEGGQLGAALAYAVGTLVLALVAVFAGVALGRGVLS